MNRAPALLLRTTIAVKIGAFLVCLAILAAVMWGFVRHETIDLPQPLIAALALMVVARFGLWIGWQIMCGRHSA